MSSRAQLIYRFVLPSLNSSSSPCFISNPKLDNLPTELLVDIFCRLPLKSLLNAKYVCKKWFSIIINDDNNKQQQQQLTCFAKLHFARYLSSNNLKHPDDDDRYILFHFSYTSKDVVYLSTLSDVAEQQHQNPLVVSLDFYRSRYHRNLVVFGSCDGFLCLGKMNLGPTLLCNPLLVDDFLQLPDIDSDRLTRFFGFDNVASGKCVPDIKANGGFGCDPETGDYKVVRILGKIVPGEYRLDFVCDVCTISSSSVGGGGYVVGEWREVIGDVPDLIRRTERGVFLNGKLHWRTISDSVVSFDLHEENFDLIRLPPVGNYGKVGRDFGLGDLGGCLSVLVALPDDCQLHIWVMKEYGREESWARDHVITLMTRPSEFGGDYRPLCMSEKGQIILIERFKDGPILYNPNSNAVSEVVVDFPGCRDKKEFFAHASSFNLIPHLCSIVSLRDDKKKGR